MWSSLKLTRYRAPNRRQSSPVSPLLCHSLQQCARPVSHFVMERSCRYPSPSPLSLTQINQIKLSTNYGINVTVRSITPRRVSVHKCVRFITRRSGGVFEMPRYQRSLYLALFRVGRTAINVSRLRRCWLVDEIVRFFRHRRVSSLAFPFSSFSSCPVVFT